MNTYKLSNIIKKEFVHDKKRFGKHRAMNLSFAYLRELFDTYYVSEWTEFDYCCRGEDCNCWIDVESSWLRLRPMTDQEYNNRIYSSIKRDINSRLSKKRIGKRKIYIAENNRVILVCIPLRDVAKHDHYIIFDKTRPLSRLQIC